MQTKDGSTIVIQRDIRIRYLLISTVTVFTARHIGDSEVAVSSKQAVNVRILCGYYEGCSVATDFLLWRLNHMWAWAARSANTRIAIKSRCLHTHTHLESNERSAKTTHGALPERMLCFTLSISEGTKLQKGTKTSLICVVCGSDFTSSVPQRGFIKDHRLQWPEEVLQLKI